MLNQTLLKAHDKILALVPKAQRAKIKEEIALFNKERTPPEVHPEKNLKAKRLNLKLIWASGQELTTDDYAVAAAHVGYAANTIVQRLAQANGVLQFKDPLDSLNTITITKVPVVKNDNDISKDWFYLSNYEASGCIPIDDLAKLLHTTPMAIKRQVTKAKGEWAFPRDDSEWVVTKFNAPVTMEQVKKDLYVQPRSGRY